MALTVGVVRGTTAHLQGDWAPPDGYRDSGSRTTRVRAGIFLALAGTLGAPGLTYAEATGGAVDSHNSGTAKLEEIVVTATRFSESNQRVAESIVALSQEALNKSSIKGISDLAQLAPGVEFDVSPVAATATNISIRGISSIIGTSTTGVFIDDTQIQSQTIAGSNFGSPYPVTFDLNRVEVLRGPQGTLFGGGSEGGAVRFIQNEPSMTEYSGLTSVEGSKTAHGSGSYEIGAAGGGPVLQDVLSFRASAYYRKDGGYIDRVDPFTNVTVDGHSNYIESSALRLALAWVPVQGVKVTPSIFWQRQFSHDQSLFYDTSLTVQSDPDNGHFRNGYLLRQPSDDSFYLATLKVEANLGFADFVSVSSYYDRHGTVLLDETALVGSLFGDPTDPTREYPADSMAAVYWYGVIGEQVASQELRLASPDRDARFTWVVGLFFDEERQTDSVYSTSLEGLPAIDPYTAVSNLNDKQYAAFGQANFEIIPKLKLTAGLRVAREQITGTLTSLGYFAGTPEDNLPVETPKETPVTPRIGIEYQANEKNLFYFSAAKGYRPGGVNYPAPSFCGVTTPLSYNSDSLWSYELGSKSQLFDDRLQLNASVYHIKWNNIQTFLLSSACFSAFNINAGSATVNGFDFDMQALLTTQLRAAIGVSYSDGKYDHTVESSGFVAVHEGDKIGYLPQAPAPLSVTASLEYDFNVLSQKSYIRVEDIYHSHNSGPFSNVDPNAINYNPALVADPSTNMLNLRANVTWGKSDIALFVQNATDAHPILNRSNSYAPNGFTPGSTLFLGSTFRPRTTGINVTTHF